MKRLIMKNLLIVLFICISLSAYAQYKDPGFPTSHVSDGIISPNSNSLFGFLNSDNFIMRHSFNMSYSSFAGQGLALGVYTNSLMYKFSDNLNVQVDASIVNSPYSTLGRDFQKSINGIYLSRAAINYMPWKDVFISFQYRNLPFNYYNPFYGSYGNRFLNRYYDEDLFFGR